LGSLGGAELVFVLVLALLLFGPRRLPQIGRTIGRTLGDLRKATTDFKMNLEKEVDLEDVRDLHGTVKAAGQDMKAAVGEFRNLGVSRDPLGLEKSDPPRPAAPAKTDSQPPAAPATTETQPPAPPAATPADRQEPAGEPAPDGKAERDS
jgi:sec-independent protein translocase protein TatB